MTKISDAERERRRQRINEVKPWLKAKGAVTESGKLISSQNALKHGLRCANPLIRMLALNSIWQQERDRIRAIVLKQKQAYEQSKVVPPQLWQDAIANLDDYLAD